MFDVLAALLGEALKKIFDVSVDRLNDQSKKRTLAISLLQLYDALVQLEEASQNALVLFGRYRDGTAAPLRTTARSTMESLINSVQKVDKWLLEVYSKLNIYNPHLASVTHDVVWSKRHTLEVIDVILAATPRVKMAGKYPTDFLIVPTELPDSELLRNFSEHGSRADAERRVAELKERIDRSLKVREVNFSESAEIAAVLEHGEATLRQVQAARAELAEFIQRAVPLSEVLTA